eukprot:TRINITY_DN71309_c0_g1_i1.p1 TRINITY_DN71309_c0_g1~~TRINITY_DN71309_c0_g1_i1.p1  ORF type:complete len:168 (+),score=36.88 TRINITY_DN71309_c0_g1_i1:43-504(+)
MADVGNLASKGTSDSLDAAENQKTAENPRAAIKVAAGIHGPYGYVLEVGGEYHVMFLSQKGTASVVLPIGDESEGLLQSFRRHAEDVKRELKPGPDFGKLIKSFGLEDVAPELKKPLFDAWRPFDGSAWGQWDRASDRFDTSSQPQPAYFVFS